MTEELYPAPTHDLARLRRNLAPSAASTFHDFSEAVFAEGALSTSTKHLIAVAVAHVTQCPYCIKGHTHAALREGCSNEELMEANLGRRRDARRRGLCSLADRARTDGEGGSGVSQRLSGRPTRRRRRSCPLSRSPLEPNTAPRRRRTTHRL